MRIWLGPLLCAVIFGCNSDPTPSPSFPNDPICHCARNPLEKMQELCRFPQTPGPDYEDVTLDALNAHYSTASARLVQTEVYSGLMNGINGNVQIVDAIWTPSDDAGPQMQTVCSHWDEISDTFQASVLIPSSFPIESGDFTGQFQFGFSLNSGGVPMLTSDVISQPGNIADPSAQRTLYFKAPSQLVVVSTGNIGQVHSINEMVSVQITQSQYELDMPAQ